MSSDHAEHSPLNVLAARWQGRSRFVVLLDAFDEGARFLALWARWRADPQRCERLWVIALGAAKRVAANGGDLAQALAHHWPVATPDLHTLRLDDGAVMLQVAFGEPLRWLRELVAPVDAFWLHGRDADPDGLPKALMRLAAREASVHFDAASDALLAGLRARGFVSEASDAGPATAHYRPTFTPKRAPAHAPVAHHNTRHALVIGAGLAGAATVRALARQGWRTTVLDRHADPAGDASGNPAGLFHGIVTPDDGPHARFNRLASFEASRAVTDAIAQHGIDGRAAGLLRLADAGASTPTMSALLAKLGLPPGYALAVSAGDASALAGTPLFRPAWWYPQGGWVDPGALVRAWLHDAGAACEFRGGVQVQRLERDADAGIWRAFDGAGKQVAQSEVVVLANASGAAHLLGTTEWPLQTVRGQLSSVASHAGLRGPSVPVAGGGYVMPERRGRIVFGATAQVGDMDASVRTQDHAHNLAQLARLLGTPTPADDPSLSGRTAWRCFSADRLPLVGAVPDWKRARAFPQDARSVPRQRGLFVLAALGSRGITWSALCGEVVAWGVVGGPAPLPASLLDAVDPARFLARAARRGKSADGASAR